MDLFRELEEKQRPTPFPRSEEMAFFLRYSGLLLDYPAYASYAKATSTFDVIRANIIIQGLINKNSIEEGYMRAYRSLRKSNPGEAAVIAKGSMPDVMKDLPYLQEDKHRIYVPVLSRALNRIYENDFHKLTEQNYKLLLSKFDPLCVDPFDLYGSKLFNSYFTKLILIKEKSGMRAYYDYDSYAIYIINEQGRLENKISLFDKGIRRRNTNHMITRIEPVIDAYFENNKEKLLETLVKNKLVSSSFLYKNMSKERSLHSKLEKI